MIHEYRESCPDSKTGFRPDVCQIPVHMHKTDPPHCLSTMAWSHITDPEQTRTRPGPGLPKPAPHLAQIQNPNLPCQNTTGTDIDEDMYKSHFQICKATFRSNIYFLLKMCTNKLCLSINSNNDIKLLQVKCHLLII